MIAIRGAGSAIAQALLQAIPDNEKVWILGRDEQIPLDAERYLFCAGVIRPQTISGQSDAEIAETFFVNCVGVIRECDQIFAANLSARICVIGSESGFTGSFDGAYAASKAALHHYVETKRLTDPRQQLVCIAPTIIRDAGMTLRRDDLDAVAERAERHPKRRWLEAAEVAALIYFCLYVDRGYLTGTVIRMHGGSHHA